MSVHPVSIIKQYCESNGYQPGTFNEKKLSKLLANCFKSTEASRTFEARELKPVPIYQPNGEYAGLSHCRYVYVISDETPQREEWVVKLQTAKHRYKRQQSFFPAAEEVAYKISKLFGWTTVPKTTIFHQNDQVKKALYRDFITTFKDQIGECPVTLTIQRFVTGEPLLTPRDIENRVLEKTYKAPRVDSSSYQRAFILEMILGNRDSRGDNIICSETGKLYEVDNEYLGCSFNPMALNALKTEKIKNVEKQVIEDVLKILPNYLRFIQKKCSVKDVKLAQFWKDEVHSIEIPQLQEMLAKNWDCIRENLTCVQRAIKQLQHEKSGFTLAELESYVQSLKKIAAEKVNKEKAEAKRQKKLEQDKINPSSELEEACSETGLILSDIFRWIEMNCCVILHSAGDNMFIYYQGPETQLNKISVINIDIARSTKLMDFDGLPAFIRAAGFEIAPQAIRDEVFEDEKLSKSLRVLRIGY